MGEKMDTLSDALINIKNCEAVGKKECTIKPASKIIGSILQIMQKNEYIGKFELIDDGKAGYYKIELVGRINHCSAVKPRYSISKNDFETWEKRYLPAKGFGLLIISTPKGIMTHNQAEKENVGGKLLAFIY